MSSSESYDAEIASSRTRRLGSQFVLVPRSGGMPLSVRVTACAVTADAARTRFSPYRRARLSTASNAVEVEGTWVIQLSELFEPGPLAGASVAPAGSPTWSGIDRVLARELAMIIAQRSQIRDRREVIADALGNGLTFHALSPRDLGLIAELELLAHACATYPLNATRLRREVLAIVDYAGLREFVDGAYARRALLEEVASPRVIAMVRELGRREFELDPDDARSLRELRVVASSDLDDHVERAFYERAAFAMPSAGRCRLHAGDGFASEAVQLAARVERAHAVLPPSMSELSQLARDPMIGGGAALAARAPGSLLIDGRGRWRRDPTHMIAQTARELAEVRHAGVGDPLELVAADQRVPVAVLRFWQDSIAAMGPVVYGHASVRRATNDQMWIDIYSNTARAVQSIKLEGIPIIATGFPPERIIGLPRAPDGMLLPATMPGVFEELLGQLAARKLPDAIAARRSLRGRPCSDWADAGVVLASLTTSLRDALRDEPRSRYIVEFLEAADRWSQLCSAHPGALLFADQVTDRSFLASYDALPGSRWLIVGLSGTGVSAAEVIFERDPTAEILMIGPRFTDGLQENGQFRALQAAHRDRFTFVEDHQVTRIDRDGHQLRITSMLADGREAHHRSPRVVVALGRAGRIPAPIEAIVLAAKREARTPRFLPLLDLDGHYLGYDVEVFNRHFHVIGAASRLLPRDLMRTSDANRLQEVVEIAEDCDAPAESGGFAGGFASSSIQAARYFRWRRAGMPSP